MEMSKGDFAGEVGVTPGRISQYIAAGIIGPDALVGEGRSARIRVELAKQQIAARRHVGQGLGNGLLTRLDQAEPTGDVPAPVLKTDDPAKLIQLERLEQEKRRNRRETIEEAATLGRLVPADDMQREIARTAQKVVNTFAGMAPDIANAIAAKFGLPQRDVLHLVKQVMNDKRATAAQLERNAAGEMPATVETVIQ
ncbi:hypothetical protein LJR016_004306 [Devosia sp. LjRoot16]|uniref:hypothetical protein n=1 Tax=Devosia sp. LjRoot16 TaxID=3342271 RepID=UPI003ED0F39F